VGLEPALQADFALDAARQCAAMPAAVCVSATCESVRQCGSTCEAVRQYAVVWQCGRQCGRQCVRQCVAVCAAVCDSVRGSVRQSVAVHGSARGSVYVAVNSTYISQSRRPQFSYWYALMQGAVALGPIFLAY
jgi:tRNA G26 N,N-dimethylase Trm1